MKLDIIEKFSFIEILFIASLGLLILILILSLIRYILFKERYSLLFRHIGALIVGIIDQIFMVIFNFQDNFLGIIV
ncbi:MAG: hypothetical protein ACTSQJ_18385, partial [Promethearchaeota archaeon]